MNLEELLKSEKSVNLPEVVKVLKTKEFEDYKKSGVMDTKFVLSLLDKVSLDKLRPSNPDDKFISELLCEDVFLTILRGYSSRCEYDEYVYHSKRKNVRSRSKHKRSAKLLKRRNKKKN